MALGLSLVRGDARGQCRAWRILHGRRGACLGIASAVGGHPALGFLAALLLAPPLTAGLAMLAHQLVLKRIGYDPERTIVATIGLYVISRSR